MASQSTAHTTPIHPGPFKTRRKSLELDAAVGPDHHHQQQRLLVICEPLPVSLGREGGPLSAHQRRRRLITIRVRPSTRVGELAACIQQRLDPAPIKDRRGEEAPLRFLGGNGNTDGGSWGIADVLSPMATIGQIGGGRARGRDPVHIFYFEEGALGGRCRWPQELVFKELGTHPPVVGWPRRPLAPQFLPRTVVKDAVVVGGEKVNSTKEEGVDEKSRSGGTDAAAVADSPVPTKLDTRQ